jgi:phosphoglycerate dehydrogenase-like enzyme
MIINHTPIFDHTYRMIDAPERDKMDAIFTLLAAGVTFHVREAA